MRAWPRRAGPGATARRGGGLGLAPPARGAAQHPSAANAKTLSLVFLNLALALSQSIAFFFFAKGGERGVKEKKKMLHCAARPVSERRGANQRPPFRKLPFMARAAAAAPYITRRREAQPPPRPRPPRQHRPLAFAAPPSPPVDTATR